MLGAISHGLPRINGMVPSSETWLDDLHERSSAVLLLFIPGAEASDPWQIVFTRRSTLVRTHKGQIGLPGGRREPCDSSPMATALRETQEEIGLDSSCIKIQGCLLPLFGLDRRPIITVIGLADVKLNELKPSPDEVAEVFALPWPLLAPLAAQNLRFNVFGRWRETPYFPGSGYHIWGLTAWIITRAKFEAHLL